MTEQQIPGYSPLAQCQTNPNNTRLPEGKSVHEMAVGVRVTLHPPPEIPIPLNQVVEASEKAWVRAAIPVQHHAKPSRRQRKIFFGSAHHKAVRGPMDP